VLGARDSERLAEVATLCRQRGGDAIAVRADVGVEADCRRLVERAVESFGRLDVLLLNAGQDMWARLDELADTALVERLMRVNYLGPVWLTHAALTGVPTRTGYCASKHALHGFFDSLRIELAGTGVSVTLVCPDFVVSEIHQRAIGADGQPLGKSPLQEAKIMSTAACARHIVAAARARKRMVLLSLRGKVGRWVRLFAPGLIDRIAERAVARGH
jgi:NAD(P)-dependent dehydrogenase (short-subunit alcohol dehydrogenase family)